MRIAWITPFNTRSAIARVSADVVEHLTRRHHEVTIIRSEWESAGGSSIVSQHPVLHWRDALSMKLDQQFDAIVANLGDNHDFHAGAIPLMEAFSCIAVFHDFYLYSLFRGWVVQNALHEAHHNQAIELTYGPMLPFRPDQVWRNRLPIDYLARHLPMTEWFAARCGAALAHSDFYIDRLKTACPGPVAVARLPFNGRNISAMQPRAGRGVTISTIGLINPNKRADRLIEALAQSDRLRETAEYRLVGAISDEERGRLKRIAKQVGFQRLTFCGEVDDATLCAEIERSDIISCLRQPILEGASASAIEGMKSGRPLIVADSGFYADLPDDLVFKVPADLPRFALVNVLERLNADEALCIRTGQRAREWADSEFTVHGYVKVLEKLLQDFHRVTPLIRLGRWIGQELSQIGLSEDDPDVGRIAAELQKLFVGESSDHHMNEPERSSSDQ